MTDLPEDLRTQLDHNFLLQDLELAKTQKSQDGTIKFLFKLKDNNFIEAVFIPTTNRNTICISSQVGCKFSCRFCASGLAGFVRNLACSEIVNQVLFVKQYVQPEKINNVV